MKISNTRTLILTLALTAIAGSIITERHEKESEVKIQPTARADFGLPPEKVKDLNFYFANTPVPELVKEVRKAYFAVSLSAPGANTDVALAELARGLNSPEERLRGAAVLLVESLLIDVAHKTALVHPENQKKIVALFALYKSRGQSQIAKMREAFPRSPTLSYLQKI